MRLLFAMEAGLRPAVDAAAALKSHLGARVVVVTLIGVAPRRGVMSCFAPLSGIAIPEDSREAALAGAAAFARQSTSYIPAGVRVKHRGIRGWSDLLEPLRGGAYDAVVLGAPPSRGRDRRRLSRAARIGEVPLFRADLPGASWEGTTRAGESARGLGGAVRFVARMRRGGSPWQP